MGQLWDELIGIQQLWEVPRSYIGDFNIVRFLSERLGGSRLTLDMENFSDFIEELSLIDLPLEGGSYTWSSGSDQPSMSRIDRVLISHDWEDHYSDVSSFWLSLIHSLLVTLSIQLLSSQLAYLLQEQALHSSLWH